MKLGHLKSMKSRTLQHARKFLLSFFIKVNLVFVATLYSSLLFAAQDEVRGTWLTTTGIEDHIRSGQKTASVMESLRDTGLNTVYVETWKNGYTNFPSTTLANLTGGTDRAFYLGTSRDLVQETLIEAHRNQLNYIGWFEYGFAAEFVGSGGSPFSQLGQTAQNNGWLLEDQSGNYANSSNGFAWMNPAVPEVREFLIDLTLEAVNNYDLDGVQFDDRLAWPREFGWDATTAALYQQEMGRALPSNLDDVRFREWRQDKVTLFAQELTAAVTAARPDLQLSVSPSVTSFSDVNYNAEWPEWQDQGLFDEYAVQVYRSSTSSFNQTLPAQLAAFDPAQRDELVVGLRANGSGANTPYADLEEMIEITRQQGTSGHSIWYSKAVVDQYDDQLASFYDVATNGHAENSFFGDVRQPPVVAAAAGSNLWSIDLPTAGGYKVIAQIGGDWREVSRGYFPAGERTLTLFNATEVEVLVDRRPIVLPDANGDGFVDAADYTVWRDTFASATDLRADFNGDEFVNAMDYDLWAAAYGQTQVAASASLVEVPEPSTILLAFFGVASLRAKCQRRLE